jgi:hypothetical protein
MKRKPWLTAMIAALSIGAAQGASLHKGEVLYQHGMVEDAKHALADVVTGDSPDDEKAGALYLLGAIALKQEHYPIAARMWTDLIQRFPASPQALEARSKLSTIPNGIQSSRVRVEAPRGDAPTDPFEGVLVTGTSADPKYSGQMVKEVVNLLGAKGVPVSRAQPQPPPGTVSVLVLAMNFGYRDSVQAGCYSAEGDLVWMEKASGLIAVSKSAAAEGLINRIKSKIETHIGDTCLRKNQT